jgi:hypothetical protein
MGLPQNFDDNAVPNDYGQVKHLFTHIKQIYHVEHLVVNTDFKENAGLR